MRDALSILDKIVSFTNGEVSYHNTLEHLNILDADYYFKLINGMLEQDLAGILLLFDDINRKGFEGDMVLNGFMEFLRNLLVCQDQKVATLLEVVENFKDKYTATAKKVSVPYLVSSLNILNETEINYRNARNKRLHVELALIKLCYLQQALEISIADNGVSKKKITETVTALAFKTLPIIEARKPTPAEQKKVPEDVKKAGDLSGNQQMPLDDGEAKLIIQTPVPKKEYPESNVVGDKESQIIHCDIAVKAEPAEIASKTKSPSTKLGALNKIRQQYSNSNGTSIAAVAKPLTDEELQNAWNSFTILLKEAKNPAAQSFERASFYIIDNNLFEIITGNNLEQKFIEQQRLQLCEHLQAWFNNKTLSYALVIKEKTGEKETIETHLNSREQYQQLIASYPLVKELKDRLRLELDY